jgi:hypothetical protein
VSILFIICGGDYSCPDWRSIFLGFSLLKCEQLPIRWVKEKRQTGREVEERGGSLRKNNGEIQVMSQVRLTGITHAHLSTPPIGTLSL